MSESYWYLFVNEKGNESKPYKIGVHFMNLTVPDDQLKHVFMKLIVNKHFGGTCRFSDASGHLALIADPKNVEDIASLLWTLNQVSKSFSIPLKMTAVEKVHFAESLSYAPFVLKFLQ